MVDAGMHLSETMIKATHIRLILELIEFMTHQPSSILNIFIELALLYSRNVLSRWTYQSDLATGQHNMKPNLPRLQLLNYRTVQKYNVRNHFSDTSSIEPFDMQGAAHYWDRLSRYRIAFSQVEKDADHLSNKSLPDRSLRDAFRSAGRDAIGDPQAAAVKWLFNDAEDILPSENTSNYSV